MDDLTTALQTLTRAGAVIAMPEDGKHASLSQAAIHLDCSVKWVRSHLTEFPNRWRMPGGEWRIPMQDIAALAKRCRVKT